MHPTAFGYVRMPDDFHKCRHLDPRKELTEYAEREGYVLARVFADNTEPSSSEFAALIDALKCADRPLLIVPTLRHFAHLPGLASAMKNHIEQETGASVVAIHANDIGHATGDGESAI